MIIVNIAMSKVIKLHGKYAFLTVTLLFIGIAEIKTYFPWSLMT